MRDFRTWGAFGVAAIAMVIFTGCTVADAASPESKNTPRASVTPSATPTPVETRGPDYQPTPTEDTMPKAWSWGDLDGTWCTGGGGLCFTVDGGTYEQMGELYVMQMTDAPLGCLRGTVTHHTYEGAHVLYCPASTPTPFTLIHPEASSAEEAVYGDDPSRDRLWLYNAAGPATYFRQ